MLLSQTPGALLPDNYWADPRTWIAIVSAMVGIIGLGYGVLAGYWSRRESRLEVLSKILQPLIRATTHLKIACDTRYKIEQLKHSFPDPTKHPEVVHRVNQFMDEYSKELEKASEQYRQCESEFGAKSFRFPDSVADSLQEAIRSFQEFGRCVNAGMLDAAALKFAKLVDDLKQIRKQARGWRLNDPIELLRKRLWPPKSPSDTSDSEGRSDFISDERMNLILELITRRVTTQAANTFAVHPPGKLLKNRELLESDTIVDELRACKFRVVFQDGTHHDLALVELLVFIHQLIVIKVEHDTIVRMAMAAGETDAKLEFNVKFELVPSHLLRPEMAKVLLSKVTFAETPSDSGPSFESDAWR